MLLAKNRVIGMYDSEQAALDAFHYAMFCAALDSGRRYKDVPGAIISRMSSSKRTALGSLTPDIVNDDIREEDIKKIIPPLTLWDKLRLRR